MDTLQTRDEDSIPEEEEEETEEEGAILDGHYGCGICSSTERVDARA